MKKKFKNVLLFIVSFVMCFQCINVMAYELTDIQMVSGIEHTLVLKPDGNLWAWGENEYGQLGTGTQNSEASPVKIMDNVKYVQAFVQTSAAIKNDGSLWLWGKNTYGNIGDGTKENKNVPVKVMDDVKYVTGYGNVSMAITNDGSLYGWGGTCYGLEMQGNIILKPVKIMDNVKDVICGEVQAVIIKEDNSLYTISKENKEPVKKLDNVKDACLFIASEISYYGLGTQYIENVYALKEDGTVWSWECGGEDNLKKEPVQIIDNVKSIEASSELYNLFVIKNDNSLWSLIGDSYDLNPVKITDNVKSAFYGNNGEEFLVVLKTDGILYNVENNMITPISNNVKYADVNAKLVLKENGQLEYWRYSYFEEKWGLFKIFDNAKYITYSNSETYIVDTNGELLRIGIIGFFPVKGTNDYKFTADLEKIIFN